MMQNQIKIMLDLQEQMNNKVDPNWREANSEWYRAVWVECGEMMDHVSYKWWKKQETNIAQVHLEIIDVMHFMLAISLRNRDPLAYIERQFMLDLPACSIQHAIDDLVHNQLRVRNSNTSYAELHRIMRCVNMGFNELFKQYCAKNVLNIFRQDNGYKEGTYHKTWNEQEDNEVLAEILYAYNGTEINFMGQIKDDLIRVYKGHLSRS